MLKIFERKPVNFHFKHPGVLTEKKCGNLQTQMTLSLLNRVNRQIACAVLSIHLY